MRFVKVGLLVLVLVGFNYLASYAQTAEDEECKTFCTQTLDGLGYTDGRGLPNAESGSCDSEAEDEKEVCCCSPKRS